MLIPEETAEFVNQETVPVRIDITDRGLPEGVRGLRWHHLALKQNPWIRRRFGHFALLDPAAEELYCVGYGGSAFQRFKKLLAAYKDMRAKGQLPPEPTEPDTLPPHLHDTILWRTFGTAFELGFDNWPEVIDIVAEGEQIVPGIRSSVIHALGDFLFTGKPYDNTNYHNTYRWRMNGMGVRTNSGHELLEVDNPKAPHLKLSLHERAAVSLVQIENLPFDEKDPELVDKIRQWWTEHKNDDKYQIEFSDEPDLRYAFMRACLVSCPSG